MRASLPYALTGLAICASVVNAVPFKYPLKNGFPAADDGLKSTLGQQAGGLLSNGDAPTGLDEDILTSFRLIAFNELFEVAFFDSLIKNVTEKAKGFEIADHAEHDFALTSLNKILAQEQLHALNANAVLKANNADPMEPCQYQFPTETYADAIALADTFTSVVLGTLGDVQALSALAAGKESAGIVRAVTSVIGQEGQQDGWFRSLQGKSPSAEPFLTVGVRDFAFTALQDFTVPKSCPNADKIKLNIFEKLAVTSDVKNLKKDAPVSFKATCSHDGAKFDEKDASVVFINGAQLPVVKPIKDVKKEGDMDYTFTADFPEDVSVMGGLTYAVVVKGAGKISFVGPDDVGKATLFGPALIMAEDGTKDVKAPSYVGTTTPPTYEPIKKVVNDGKRDTKDDTKPYKPGN